MLLSSTKATPQRSSLFFSLSSMELRCLREPLVSISRLVSTPTTFVTRRAGPLFSLFSLSLSPFLFLLSLSPWKLHEFMRRPRDSEKSLALPRVPLTGFTTRDRTNWAILRKRTRLVPRIWMSLNTNGLFTFSNLTPLANDSPGDEEYWNVAGIDSVSI